MSFIYKEPITTFFIVQIVLLYFIMYSIFIFIFMYLESCTKKYSHKYVHNEKKLMKLKKIIVDEFYNHSVHIEDKC